MQGTVGLWCVLALVHMSADGVSGRSVLFSTRPKTDSLLDLFEGSNDRSSESRDDISIRDIVNYLQDLPMSPQVKNIVYDILKIWNEPHFIEGLYGNGDANSLKTRDNDISNTANKPLTRKRTFISELCDGRRFTAQEWGRMLMEGKLCNHRVKLVRYGIGKRSGEAEDLLLL